MCAGLASGRTELFPDATADVRELLKRSERDERHVSYERADDGDIAAAFFEAVLLQADTERLLSHEHFTVDGTLLEAWASHKSFRPRDEDPPSRGGGRNPTVNFHRLRRCNATHQSTTDPDVRLYKKARGREARLGYLGHVLMEHRSGLLVDAMLTHADGYAECDAALLMVQRRPGDQDITIAGDKAYDQRGCVAGLRHLGATPHVAQYTSPRRPSAIDGRTTRHPGYAISQRKRKLVEQAFGWMKTIGGPPETAPPRRRARRLDLHLHGRCVQHRPHATPAGRDRLRQPHAWMAARPTDAPNTTHTPKKDTQCQLLFQQPASLEYWPYRRHPVRTTIIAKP